MYEEYGAVGKREEEGEGGGEENDDDGAAPELDHPDRMLTAAILPQMLLCAEILSKLEVGQYCAFSQQTCLLHCPKFRHVAYSSYVRHTANWRSALLLPAPSQKALRAYNRCSQMNSGHRC